MNDAELRSHLKARFESARIGIDPFRHLYIENMFPESFYDALRSHMLAAKYGGSLQDRQQDSQAFTNKRFNLVSCRDSVISDFRSAFLAQDVMHAVLSRFYLEPENLIGNLVIHEEFEYFFTKAGRFQNIHVDIPPKILSFVFYIPERKFESEVAEKTNATILYDKDLTPHHRARFKPNSACIFAPHFHSYHGFNSTEDRDVLVMFYVDPAELGRWRALRGIPEEPPFNRIRDLIEEKLRHYPLVEFGNDPDAIRRERDGCRINAPQGRVLE